MAELERLIVKIDADTRDLRRQMAGAERQVKQTTSRMNRAFRRMQTSIAPVVRRLASFRSGLAAAAGTSGLGLMIRRSLKAAQSLQETATKLGVGVEALQELRFAASQSGIAIQTFDMALQRFTRRAAEADKGTGEAKDAIAELGLALRDADGNLRASEALLGDVADALSKIEDPAVRLRLAFKLFDSEGVVMINMLARGSAGLAEFRRQARETGQVTSAQLIAKSAVASRQMDLLGASMRSNFEIGLLKGFVGEFRDLQELITDPEFQRSIQNLGETLGRTMRTLAENAETAARAIAAIAGASIGGRVLGAPGAVVGGVAGFFAPDILRALDNGEGEAKAAQRRGAPAAPAAPVVAGTGGGKDKAAKAADKARKALKQMIAALERETEVLGQAEDRRDRYRLILEATTMAQDAGLKNYGHYIEKIGAAADALAAIEAANEAVTVATEKANAAIERGVSLTEAMQNPLERLNAELADYGALLESGAISQETFNRAQAAAQEVFQEATEGVDSFTLAVENMATAISTRLEDAILDFKGFADVVRALEADIIRIMLRLTVTKPLEGAITSAVGGLDFGSIFASTAHSGGVVGSGAGPVRAVSPAAFAGAPRFHGGGIVGVQPNLSALGLRNDERPIIARVGETVLPRGQRAGSVNYKLNIHVPPGSDARGFRESAAFVARRAADEIDRRARFR